ncbi:MAG: ribulose-phosphate 3-epimerase [Anaerolineaceae bacterium]|nr:MAG: ribulose-phosphate 3-epimerase [Anaerolineaceae bacterium]
MPASIKIAPSILSADFTRLGDDIRALEAARADWIHIDVMDGRFVPNITMGPLIVAAVKRITTLPLDVHLMIVQPDAHIVAFADAGADRITVHLEADTNLHRTISAIREAGCSAGVAVNPHTPAIALEAILPYVDMVTVMTVNPGFGGQALIAGMWEKVRALRRMTDVLGVHIDIQVDGGINADNAQMAVNAGANVLVAGSSVFKHPDGIAGGVEALRDALI